MNGFKIDLCHEIILSLLKEPMHGRALAKTLETPLTTVQSRINNLIAEGILEYRAEGKNKILSIKNTPIARVAILMSEQYKLMKLYQVYPEMRAIIPEITKQCTTTIIIFGSFAKFLAKKGSDIDVYLETRDRKIKKNVQDTNTSLSVKIGMLAKDDPLSREIMQEHIIVQGLEDYYEKFPYETQTRRHS
jgi:predicted nucleotidyltransferase